MDRRKNNGMTCLNCGHEAENHYCSHCGQRTDAGRLTVKGLLTQAWNSVTNLDRGFFHTAVALATSPRSTVLQYIAGQRRALFNPLKFAILCVALLTFLDAWLRPGGGTADGKGAIYHAAIYEAAYDYGKFLRRNIKYLWLLNTVFLAVSFSRWYRRYTLAEHLVVAAFVLGQTALLTSIFLPLFDGIFIVNPLLLGGIAGYYIVIFRNEKVWWKHLVATFISLTVAYLAFFLVPFPFHLLIKYLTTIF